MKSGLSSKPRRSLPIDKRPESVLVVVIDNDNKVLCLHRSDRAEFWQSVTGSLEATEDALSAAWRELEEEVGLSKADGKLIDCHKSWWFEIYPHWRHRYADGVSRNLEHVFVFQCGQKKNIILSDEHLSYCWLSKEQAIEKMSSETNKEAISLFV